VRSLGRVAASVAAGELKSTRRAAPPFKLGPIRDLQGFGGNATGRCTFLSSVCRPFSDPARKTSRQLMEGQRRTSIQAGRLHVTERRFSSVSHARAMRDGGFWVDRTYDEVLGRAITSAPQKVALVASRADRFGRRRFTFAELGEMVSRASAALRSLGVAKGDVVSVQLPNWWEFAVLALAAFRVGAVINPLMPIFREHELGYMLQFARTKVFVAPKHFRGFDYEEMARSLQPKLPNLSHIVIVDGDGLDNFDRVMLSGEDRLEPNAEGVEALSTDEMAVLIFTSGTTGAPKGVMHCQNALMACNIGIAERLGLDAADTFLVCSPIGHMLGFAAGLFLGITTGATVVLQDLWDPELGLTLMVDEGVTYTAAPATFLSDLCEAVSTGGRRPTKLRSLLCAGAPIPPILIERAWREFGLCVCSAWGMTEALASTVTEPRRALEKSSTTDGRPIDGTEVKIVDSSGDRVAPGEIGQLRVRGAGLALGYYKRADLEPFDPDGWLDTGDLASVDAEGYIRIRGRIKDIIIRGGENIPVVEIENLLFKHASVIAAAVVGYPDTRLGERACAFVLLRPGHSFDLAAMQAYMAANKVAKPYWPERVEVVADLPRTPSGKVQKYELRERARAFSAAPA
jgi:cyclohexanecarboxylate-CoA ligase